MYDAKTTCKLVIYGAGGLGQVVYDILCTSQRFKPYGFLDSDTRLHGKSVCGLSVFGGVDQLTKLRWEGVTHATVAIGNNDDRVRIAQQLRENGIHLASAIHPLAGIASNAKVAEHVVIGPRASVCVNVQIAEHVVIGAGSIVDHDCKLDRGCFLHPSVRLAGGVHVGSMARLEVGAAVIPYRSIGTHARIAPGAVVTKDIPNAACVAGVPATPDADDWNQPSALDES